MMTNELLVLVQHIVWALIALRAVSFLHKLLPVIKDKDVHVEKGVKVDVE